MNLNPQKWSDVYRCSKPTHSRLELYACDLTQNVITPTVKVAAGVTLDLIHISWNLVSSVAKLAGEAL